MLRRIACGVRTFFLERCEVCTVSARAAGRTMLGIRAGVLVWMVLAVSPMLSMQARAEPLAQATPSKACSAIRLDGMTLALDVQGLKPSGTKGNPELCLMHFTADDTYSAILVPVETSSQFDAVKTYALAH